MNREEILARAKNETKDEMELQIRDKSMKWTYIAMVLTAAIFAYIRETKGQPMMDLCVTVCVSVTVGQFYRFIKSRDTYCLFLSLISLAVGIFSLVRFIMGH